MEITTKTWVVCFLTDVTRGKIASKVTTWLTPSLMLLMTSLIGTERKLELDKKCGLLTELIKCKITAGIPRVTASAELSLVATWCHWSTLLDTKISQSLFATKLGFFSLDIIHWRTVGLSVHKHTWLTVTVSARNLSFFSRVASKTNHNYSFCENHYFYWCHAHSPQYKRKLCFYFDRRNCYSGSRKCDGT